MRKLFVFAVLACLLTGGVALAQEDLEALCADNESPGDGRDLGLLPMWHDDEGDDEDDDEGDDNLVCICHMPPGNPGNSETLCLPRSAVCAHLLHGDTLGPCDEPCGGVDAVECEEGEFCKYPLGECAEDAEGMCMPIPGVCPSHFAPVCGCDLETYSNECYADAAGVGVAEEGACADQQACGGIIGETCEDGEFCMRPPGECSMDAEGICIAPPVGCPSIYRPVCGCDDMTYDNACLALAAGVSIAAPGECEEEVACGGPEGRTCEEGEFCKIKPGMCEEDAKGICAEKPDACPAIFQPVCGCDGVTYDNPCLADAAGETIAAPGVCEDSGTACTGDGADTCSEDQFCMQEEGSCSDTADGTCVDKPIECTQHYSPVCGCDGMTYDNACLAAADGVNVASAGECEEAEACGGTAGVACGDGDFCLREMGSCEDEDEGVCTEIPELCPPIFAQVCGCNNMEYASECFAHAVGVTVKNEGPCETTSKAVRGARRGWLRSN